MYPRSPEHKKRNKKIESKLDIQTQDELLVPKDEPEDYKGIHVRG